MELDPAGIVDPVIKRKRKRHPVDPCLGFYSSEATSPRLFPSIDGQQHTDFLATSRLHGHNIFQPNSPVLPTKVSLAHNFGDVPSSPSAKSISSPLSDSAQLPVEEFLKRIARRKPLRKYGRQRRRIIETSSSESSPAYERRLKRRRTASTNHCHASLSPSRLSPVTPGKKEPIRFRKNNNTKMQAKSLAERLYQAAVMSHGNPADCLINPGVLDGSVPSSRLPLQFIPETPGLMNAKHRTWSLVDPRKAVPFRSASFLSQKSFQDPEAILFKPLTRWRDATPRDALGSPRKLQKVSAPATNKHPMKPLSHHPLSFIPFQDAEEAYSLRLHLNRFHYHYFFYKTSLLTRFYFIPLRLPSANMQPASPTEDLTRAFVTPLVAKNVQEMHYSSPSAIRLLEPSSPLLPICTMKPQCPEPLCNRTQTLDPLESNNDTVLLPSSSPPFHPSKLLKPLASFFEGFLERGRHAEKIQASTRPRSADQSNSTSYRRQSFTGSSSRTQDKYDLFYPLL